MKTISRNPRVFPAGPAGRLSPARALKAWCALAVLSSSLCTAEWARVDDFQGYPQALLTRGTNGWAVYNDLFTKIDITSDVLAQGNQVARIAHGDDKPETNRNFKHDVFYHRGALNLPPGSTSTIFLRFLVESGLDKNLGHVRGPKPVENVSISISVTEGILSSPYQRGGIAIEGLNLGIIGLGRTRRADQKGPSPSIQRNTWYRLWMVLNNAPGGEANTSRAFIQEDRPDAPVLEVPGMLVGSNSKNYRPAIWNTLGVLKAPSCPLTDMMIDDVYVDNSGENRTYPISSKDAAEWKGKLRAEAQKYAHLVKKAATHEQAQQQAAQLVAAMTPEERYELVRGSTEGVPGYLRLGIAPLGVADAGSGINNGNPAARARRPNTVAYPCTLALAATWNPTLAEAYGRSIGEECRRYGISILLGPGMNLYRSSVGGRNFEYFGEDPLLTGRQVASYVRGLQGAGTAATIKHFIGNEYEFHRHGVNTIIDERTLHEVYMEPFRMGLEVGACCVMTSYNQLQGEWAGQSHYVNTDLLRKDLGFKGLIMTDWIATCDGAKFAASGANMEMPGGISMTRDRELVFGKPEIDRMAQTILAMGIQAGFYDRPELLPDLETHRPKWEEVARQTNLEAITLLKNNGLLPLAPNFQGKKILVTGNRATTSELGGSGSGHVPGYNLVNYLQAVTSTFTGAEILNPPRPEKLSDAELQAADLVLLFAGMAEGEGRDRIFELPDDALIQRCTSLNPRTVVCLVTGGGVKMEWADKAAGLVHTYFGGQTGATALMDILTGKAEPMGRLPFTIETRVEDAPGGDLKALQKPNDGPAYEFAKLFFAHELFPNAAKTHGYVWDNVYKEGVLIGHRWYEANHLPVRFPLGFGLGYTTFAYEGLKTEVKGQSAKVRFQLKNTGSRPGAEVAQVYVTQKVCSVPRPLQELKSFQKVRLDAGQSREIEIELTPEAFRYWNPTSRQWTIDPGAFEIHVGASSADIRLKETVEIP